MLALLLLLLQAQRYNRDGTRMKISANTLVRGGGGGSLILAKWRARTLTSCVHLSRLSFDFPRHFFFFTVFKRRRKISCVLRRGVGRNFFSSRISM